MARDPETDQHANAVGGQGNQALGRASSRGAQAFRFIGGKNGGITSFLQPETTALEPSQNVFWGSG